MHQCCVFGCPNQANHAFPRDDKTRKLWEAATKRKNFRAKKHSKICAAHFNPADFIKIGKYSGLQNTRRILKKGVVPSVFAWSKTEDLKSKNRRERAELHDVKRKLPDREPEASTSSDTISTMANAICRACLQDYPKHSLMLNHVARQALCDLAGIVIKPEDNNKMPQAICDDCLSLLNKFSEFRKEIIRNNEFLLEHCNEIITHIANTVKIEQPDTIKIKEETVVVKEEIVAMYLDETPEVGFIKEEFIEEDDVLEQEFQKEDDVLKDKIQKEDDVLEQEFQKEDDVPEDNPSNENKQNIGDVNTNTCKRMPNRRKRKSERDLCSQSILEEARRRVERGESKRKVAASYGMTESTLRSRLKRISAATKLGRYDKTFSNETEDEFCKYLQELDIMFYGLTAKDLRIVAYEFAELNNVPHRFNKEEKIAGKEWLSGFMQRHPDISLRKPMTTNITKGIGFNKQQCDRFFTNLAKLMDKHQFSPTAIYNMDETRMSTVPDNPPKVFSTEGAVNKICSTERGIHVIVVTAMSAAGHFIPPTFIFRGKRMEAELLDGAPPSSIGMVSDSDSSFIDSKLFLNWLSHFKDHTRPSKEHPILLILHNRVSHTTLAAVNFYREKNIVVLTLPPRSSKKMQPLDNGFHNILKKYFANECEKWTRNHPGRAITVDQMSSLFTPAFLKAATIECATECFKLSGIYPCNPDIFTEAYFLPNTVTERPLHSDP